MNGNVLERLRPYRALGWAALVVFVAFGFDFKTPSSQFRELRAAAAAHAQRDSTIKLRQDSLEASMGEMRRFVKALAVGQCLDRPRRDLQLMGLPCEELLGSGRLR